MRVPINFILLCFFLLGGGQYLHADTHANTICDSPSWNFVKKQQIKVKTAEPGSVLIEEADVDLDEEFHSNDDLNNGRFNKIVAVKHNLLDSWYLTFSSTFTFKDCSKQIEVFAQNFGDSNPIYLIIGVLRI